MTQIVFRFLGLLPTLAMAAVGRWAFLNPSRFVKKLYSDSGLEPTGHFWERLIRAFGLLLLFVGVYSVLAVFLSRLPELFDVRLQ